MHKVKFLSDYRIRNCEMDVWKLKWITCRSFRVIWGYYCKNHDRNTFFLNQSERKISNNSNSKDDILNSPTHFISLTRIAGSIALSHWGENNNKPSKVARPLLWLMDELDSGRANGWLWPASKSIPCCTIGDRKSRDQNIPAIWHVETWLKNQVIATLCLLLTAFWVLRSFLLHMIAWFTRIHSLVYHFLVAFHGQMTQVTT